jgi:hypothetical protein
VCDGHDLILLRLKRFLDVRYVNGPTKVGVYLVDLGAIRMKAKTERERTSARKTWTCAYQSAKPSPKYPVLSTRTFSPGSTRLAETYVFVGV